MKHLKLFVFLLMVTGISGCDQNRNISQHAKNTFKSMYSNASSVSWEIKSGYNVADFRHDGKEKEAWFDQDGVWWLTESEIPVSNLPDNIRNIIREGQYGNWNMNSVNYIEKKDSGPFYVIEMEQNDTDIHLYYNVDGSFIKETSDDRDHHLPYS